LIKFDFKAFDGYGFPLMFTADIFPLISIYYLFWWFGKLCGIFKEIETNHANIEKGVLNSY
jgi:hypothetical protein